MECRTQDNSKLLRIGMGSDERNLSRVQKMTAQMEKHKQLIGSEIDLALFEVLGTGRGEALLEMTDAVDLFGRLMPEQSQYW